MPRRLSSVLFQIPLLGAVAEKVFSPPTFYRTDLYFAMERVIRQSVVQAANQLAQRGLEPLTAEEQRPLLREFVD